MCEFKVKYEKVSSLMFVEQQPHKPLISYNKVLLCVLSVIIC